jgi:hypothetical protein
MMIGPEPIIMIFAMSVLFGIICIHHRGAEITEMELYFRFLSGKRKAKI